MPKLLTWARSRLAETPETVAFQLGSALSVPGKRLVRIAVLPCHLALGMSVTETDLLREILKMVGKF